MSTGITNQLLCIKIQCSLILQSSVLVLLVTVCSSSLRLLKKTFSGICCSKVNQLESRQAPFVSDCNFKFPDVVSHISHSIQSNAFQLRALRGTSHVTTKQHCKYATSVDIQKRAIKS